MTSHPDGHTSFGGSRKVCVKLVSSGDKVLGVTYAVPAAPAISPLSTDGEGMKLPQHLRECDPADLAPGGVFARWVPSAADIEPRSLVPTRALHLQHRARGVFRPAADTLARYMLGGRSVLTNFDVVDVLPLRPSRRQRAGYTAEDCLMTGLATLHTAVASGECSGGSACTGGDGSGCRDAFGYELHLRSPEFEPETSAPPLPDHAKDHEARCWYLGRVKWEAAVPTSGASGGDGSSSPSATTHPYVYWFEPCFGKDGLTIRQLLCRARVDEVAAISPAGTHTIPHLPDMSVESRRVGGLWAPSTLLYADRHCVVVQAARQSRDLDRNADKPKEVPSFGKGASRLKRTVASRLAAAPTPSRRGSKTSEPFPLRCIRLHLGRLHNLDTGGARGMAVLASGSSTSGGGGGGELASPDTEVDGRADRIARMAGRPLMPTAHAATGSRHPPSPPAGSPLSISTPPPPHHVLLLQYAALKREALDASAPDASAGEVIPHNLWHLLLARPGHYCSAEVATPTGPTGGTRRGSMFFAAMRGASNSTATSPHGGAVYAATQSTLQGLQSGAITISAPAKERLMRKSVVDGFFGSR